MSELIRPQHLILEVSGHCNFACVMCERTIKAPNVRMSDETFDVALETLVPHVPCTELSGLGEPTMHPNFRRMAAGVQEKGNILYFPTNGSFLHKFLSGEFENSDRTRVSLSIDAATEETYKKVRILGDWKTTWENAAAFRARYPKARLTTTFTAGAYNVDEFPAFAERALDYGFDEVDFRAVRAWVIRPEKISLRYRKDRVEKALGAAEELLATRPGLIRAEPIPFAEGLENKGDDPGFVSYMDIVTLGSDPCGGSSTIGGSYTGSCLALDVPVLLSNGKHKAAGDLKVGDRLRSFSHYGQYMDGKVTDVIEMVSPTVEVETKNGVERVSTDHLYVIGMPDEIVPAKMLEVGDELYGPKGERVPVLRITPTGKEEKVRTFILDGGGMGFYSLGGGGSLKVTSAPIGPSSVSSRPTKSEKGIRILHAPPLPRKPAAKAKYAGVLLVTYGGDVATCAARHPIGHIGAPFEELIAHAKYQEHLAARSGGEHNKSPWCRNCEKMI